MNTEIVTYTPNQKHRVSWIRTWAVMLRNVIESKDLIWQLFKRDFLMQYKKSFLGMGWIILGPIIGIISWVFMNSTGILNPGDVGIPYPAYVLLSSSLWGLFMGLYASSKNTLSAGASFITQVDYPHEALLFKEVFQQLVAFLITFIINIIILTIFKVTLPLQALLFPIVILPLIFLAGSIGLIMGLISVVAVDITKIFDTLLGFAFFITPIIYSQETDNEILSSVIKLNPLTYLIGGARDILIEGNISNFSIYILVSIVAFILLLVSLRLFYVSEEQIIEKMI